MELLLQLLEILRSNPDLTTSALIERWRETPTEKHLSKLAGLSLELNESELAVEFPAIMDSLIKQSTDLRFDDLQAKLNQGQLSDSEMEEYRSLLKQMSASKSATK